MEYAIKFDDGMERGSNFLVAQRQAPYFLIAHRKKPRRHMDINMTTSTRKFGMLVYMHHRWFYVPKGSD